MKDPATKILEGRDIKLKVKGRKIFAIPCGSETQHYIEGGHVVMGSVSRT